MTKKVSIFIELNFRSEYLGKKEPIKISIQTSALEYLLGKQGSKGRDISYSSIKMAEYIMPCETELTIEQKRYIFGMRNRMLPISSNFPKKEINCKCYCRQTEDMKHIYESECS